MLKKPRRSHSDHVNSRNRILKMQTKILPSHSTIVSRVLACDNCYGPQSDITFTRHVRRMQPSALNATVSPSRALEWGQLNLLHTTDTHGWLEGHIKERNYGADWGDYVSFTTHMKQMASNYGVDMLFVDTGILWLSLTKELCWS